MDANQFLSWFIFKILNMRITFLWEMHLIMATGNSDNFESELIKRGMRGDREALGILFIMHGSRIERIVMRMGFDKQMREDIMQEVAEQFIRKIGTFKGNSRFSTWLYRVTVNTALQTVRREKRHPRMTLYKEPLCPGDVSSDYEKKEMRNAILDSVSSLPGRQKKCASLYYFGEMSVTEIAQTLSIKENAVKASLFKARKNIANQLEKRGVL